MGADMIILFEPSVDDNLRLLEGWEPFSIQDFAPERSIEAFIVTVFPRTAGIDLKRLDAGLLEPGLEVASDELRSVVWADEGGNPAKVEESKDKDFKNWCPEKYFKKDKVLKVDGWDHYKDSYEETVRREILNYKETYSLLW